MKDPTVNFCTACPTGQHCCSRLSELMLTEDEFESRFKRHEERLLIDRADGAVSVTPREGSACPHWHDNGCQIYMDRPIDCRLFPYIMTRRVGRRDRVRITFTRSSLCQCADILCDATSESDACALIVEFGKKVYGDRAVIIAGRDSRPLSGIRRRISLAFH